MQSFSLPFNKSARLKLSKTLWAKTRLKQFIMVEKYLLREPGFDSKGHSIHKKFEKTVFILPLTSQGKLTQTVDWLIFHVSNIYTT